MNFWQLSFRPEIRAEIRACSPLSYELSTERKMDILIFQLLFGFGETKRLMCTEDQMWIWWSSQASLMYETQTKCCPVSSMKEGM